MTNGEFYWQTVFRFVLSDAELVYFDIQHAYMYGYGPNRIFGSILGQKYQIGNKETHWHEIYQNILIWHR